MDNLTLKQKLLKYCHEYVDHRIATATQAMESAQEAANEEGKNSAGDKYETGRAMMQIERNQAAEQLAEALKLRMSLTHIHSDHVSESVELGSLVITKTMSIFLAIGIGKATVDDKDYLIVAPHSPLGKLIMNKEVKQQFVMNGETRTITSIL